MSIVNNAIQDGISQCRVRDCIMPFRYGCLRCHNRRRVAVTIFHDFQDVPPFHFCQRGQAPIINDEKLDTSQFLQEFPIASVGPCEIQFKKESWGTFVKSRVSIPAGFLGKGAGKKRFAATGRAGDN